jgi:hypothetical protein
VAVALSFVHGARVGGLWALRAAAFATLALSPWLILHVPHYLDASTLGGSGVPGGPQAQIKLFSSYTNLIMLALLAASWAVLGQIHDRSKTNLTRLVSVVAAATTAGLAYGIVMLLSPILAGYETSVRYSIPFLLGIVPLIGVFSVRTSTSRPSWLNFGLPLAGYLMAIIPFVPSMLQRYQQAVEFHSILASDIVRTQKYIQYNRAALSAASADVVLKLQHLIPPGEPFLAWISQPYDLDFRRNPILDADAAGMATNWAHLPPTVRYVFWEYHGFAVLTPDDFTKWAQSPGWHERLISMRALSFTQSLSAELKTAKIIYRDNRFVVALLPPGGGHSGDHLSPAKIVGRPSNP